MMNVYEFGESIGVELLPHQKALLGELYGLPHEYSLANAEQAASRLIPFTQPPTSNGIAALMARRMGSTYLAAFTALYEFYRLQALGVPEGDVTLTTRRETATTVFCLLETLARRANMAPLSSSKHDARNRTVTARLTIGANSLIVYGALSNLLIVKGNNTVSLVMDGIVPHAKMFVEQVYPPMAMLRNPDGTIWGKVLVTDTTPELDNTCLAFLEYAGLHTYILGYGQ